MVFIRSSPPNLLLYIFKYKESIGDGLDKKGKRWNESSRMLQLDSDWSKNGGFLVVVLFSTNQNPSKCKQNGGFLHFVTSSSCPTLFERPKTILLWKERVKILKTKSPPSLNTGF